MRVCTQQPFADGRHGCSDVVVVRQLLITQVSSSFVTVIVYSYSRVLLCSPVGLIDPSRALGVCLKILKKEGIECLAGELLLVKLQNASFEGLHGQVTTIFY